jgi:phenylalanyl-tRNA synthetase beta chain
MKFTLSWLKDHLSGDYDAATVVDTMTRAGLEVEHVIDRTADLAPFTVAHILSAEQHPNADRLRVCQVATRDGTLQIVCGAPNARAGIAVVYAAVGTYVPGIDVTLSKASIRGVESNGMLCSAKELNAGVDGDGIIELPTDIAVGTPAATALGLDDAVIDFEVTPNRPDWLGVHGIARDLAAAGLGVFQDKPAAPASSTGPCPVTVTTQTPACPVFAARVITGLTIKPSPDWLQRRLNAIGLRQINAVVDVTNFISFDRARPMHAYDLGTLSGTVTARMAKDGEAFTALDGKDYTLTADHCVIADDRSVLGLGGVMGGVASGVSDATTAILLESAAFDPVTIARTGRALGIFSDSQYRFARGVDAGNIEACLDLATALILAICGGAASAITVAGAIPAAPPAFSFNPAAVATIGGLPVGSGIIKNTLEALGVAVTVTSDTAWTITPPSWRRDLIAAADLVEEVTRLVGLDAIPAVALPDIGPARLPALFQRARTARRHLAASGYLETISWSFVSEAAAKLFDGGDAALKLANPIAAELSDMRPSALIGLLHAVARNQAKSDPDCALFEVGPVYSDDTPTGQRTAVAAILAPKPPRHWAGATSDDVFTLKGDLYALLEALGAPVGNLQLDQSAAPAGFAPGQSAILKLGKTPVAAFGALHPRVLKAFDVSGPVFGFELWLEALPAAKAKATKTKPAWTRPDQTPVSRDFAFVVDQATAAGALTRAAIGVDKALITSAHVFDVYSGTGLAEGQKSVAIEVTLQPVGKALTDAEIDATSKAIIAAVTKATGGTLRS